MEFECEVRGRVTGDKNSAGRLEMSTFAEAFNSPLELPVNVRPARDSYGEIFQVGV